jgi:hypothetical protein
LLLPTDAKPNRTVNGRCNVALSQHPNFICNWSETLVSGKQDSNLQPTRGATSAGGLLLSLVCLVLFPFAATFEDQIRPWMISRKTATGLFRQPSPQGQAPAPPQSNVPAEPWKYIVLHHSGTSAGSLQSIHQQHLRRKDSHGNPWKGIAYHFVVGNGNGMPDGSVEATFRWKEQLHGAHAGHALYNSRGIGICLIGNFEQSSPTKAQLTSLRKLLTQLSQQHQILPTNIIGHSTFRNTACPGRNFPLQQLREQISNSLNRNSL